MITYVCGGCSDRVLARDVVVVGDGYACHRCIDRNRSPHRSVVPIGGPTSGDRSHERTDGRTDVDGPTDRLSSADPSAHEQWCFSSNWHPAHTWVYGGREVYCNGMTVGVDDPHEEPEGRCCADPLCPCDYKPGWTGRGTEAMDQ